MNYVVPILYTFAQLIFNTTFVSNKDSLKEIIHTLGVLCETKETKLTNCNKVLFSWFICSVAQMFVVILWSLWLVPHLRHILVVNKAELCPLSTKITIKYYPCFVLFLSVCLIFRWWCRNSWRYILYQLKYQSCNKQIKYQWYQSKWS
jgi:hypothetical protein